MIAQHDMEKQMSVELERLEAGPPVDGPHPGDETPGG